MKKSLKCYKLKKITPSNPGTDTPYQHTLPPANIPPRSFPYKTMSFEGLLELGVMDIWLENFSYCESLIENCVLGATEVNLENFSQGPPVMRAEKKIGNISKLGKRK